MTSHQAPEWHHVTLREYVIHTQMYNNSKYDQIEESKGGREEGATLLYCSVGRRNGRSKFVAERNIHNRFFGQHPTFCFFFSYMKKKNVVVVAVVVIWLSSSGSLF